MLDEFEIRLASKKTRMFPGDSLAKDRRDAEDKRRSKEAIRRKSTRDRRQETLAVEHNRRKEQRRKGERRLLEDRRVTSDWSEERLQEERLRMNNRSKSERSFIIFAIAVSFIIFLCFLIIFKDIDLF